MDIPEIPAAIREIQRRVDAATATSTRTGSGTARHIINFKWGGPGYTAPVVEGEPVDDAWLGEDAAEFVSDGALHVPREGDRLRLHGIPVVAGAVETDYDRQDDGTITVFTTVSVEPVVPDNSAGL